MRMVCSEFWLLRQKWPRLRIWISYRYVYTSLPMSSRSLPKECMPCYLPISRLVLLSVADHSSKILAPDWKKFIQPPWLRRVIWQFAKLASTLPVSFQFAVPADCVDQLMDRSRVQSKYFIILFAASTTFLQGLARWRLSTDTAYAISKRTEIAQYPIDPMSDLYSFFISSDGTSSKSSAVSVNPGSIGSLTTTVSFRSNLLTTGLLSYANLSRLKIVILAG